MTGVQTCALPILDEVENGQDIDMHELPHLLRCNMTFIPIYNFLPKKSAEAPFIGINNTEGSKKEQKEWIKYLNEAGYLAVVCYNFDEARDTIINYLS